jgi:hypothetical protein
MGLPEAIQHCADSCKALKPTCEYIAACFCICAVEGCARLEVGV